MTRMTPKQLRQLILKQAKQKEKKEQQQQKSKRKKKTKRKIYSVDEARQTFFKKSESQEQSELCNWLKEKYPDVLYNIDLAGLDLNPIQRSAYNQRKMRGHPDLILYEWYKDKYCALAIEFKRTGEKIKLDEHQKEQLEFIMSLRSKGRLACFVIGIDNAKKVISLYLEGADIERINYFIHPKIES